MPLTAKPARTKRSTPSPSPAHAPTSASSKGVFGFTLKDIADPLEVRVPAIYKHYESRDDVLIAVSRRFIALLSEQFTYAPEALAQPLGEIARVESFMAPVRVRNEADYLASNHTKQSLRPQSSSGAQIEALPLPRDATAVTSATTRRDPLPRIDPLHSGQSVRI